MSNTLKNQLQDAKKHYANIEKKKKAIQDCKESIQAAEALLTERAPSYGYEEGRHLKKELQRQEEEKTELIRKKEEALNQGLLKLHISVFVALYALIVIVFLVNGADLGSVIGTLIGTGIMLAFVAALTYVPNKLILSIFTGVYLKIYSSKVRRNTYPVQTQKAKDQDKAAKEEMLRRQAQFRAQNKAQSQQLKAKNTPLLEKLNEELAALLRKNDAFISLPTPFNSLSGIEKLLKIYDACSKEWFEGKEPRDLKMLIRYYEAQDPAAARSAYWETRNAMDRVDRYTYSQMDQTHASELRQTRDAAKERDAAEKRLKQAKKDLHIE